MKKLIWVLVAIVLVGAVAYLYVFHKPHRDIAAEDASETLTAAALVEEYNEDVTSANAQYLDQVIEVSGTLGEVTENSVKLEEGVYCDLTPGSNTAELKVGQRITVKGRIVNYDELFEEVRLDNGQLVEVK